MKSNKKILYALGVALATVWGMIAYQLIDAVAANKSTGPEVVRLPQDAGPAGKRHPYIDNVKDPFRYFTPQVVKRIQKPKTNLIPQIFVPPPFTLTGIIVSDSRQMAVLEAKDGTVQFLSEGDSTAGLRIQVINRKQVTYVYRNQKSTWTLAH